jgi:hypothetical protein
MDDDKVLAAIGSTEETSFNEFCQALADGCPDGRDEWREMFARLRRLENEGLIEVSKLDGKIDGLILSEAGANRIRAKLDARRGLLTIEGI